MAKATNSNIAKVGTDVQLPSFMAQEDVKLGQLEMQEFVIVPRLKIVQKQSANELLEHFKPGDAILLPTQAIVAEKEQPVLFTPLLFYPEWITWNPLETKGSEPAIAYRTMDRNDPLVAKARDPKLRRELLTKIGGKDVFRSHTEHLNFVVQLHNHPITDPFVISFARSDHFTGGKFATMIRMRKAPMFGCVFQLATEPRKNNQGDWFGYSVTNPPEGTSTWVSAEQYEQYKNIHLEYSKLVEERRLQAVQDDEREDGAAPATTAPADADRSM